MPSVISGDANVSATEFGFLDGVTSGLQSQIDAKLATATASSTYLPIAGGKILQVVRATDSTERTTTSTSFVDASISVTITPQKNDSAVLLIAKSRFFLTRASSNTGGFYQITDSSNNPIAGAENNRLLVSSLGATALQLDGVLLAVAWATPATTSATTYKLRFRVETAGTFRLENDDNTGQMYAIEVSA